MTELAVQNKPPKLRPCINFEGGLRKSGYGYTQFMGRQFLAHRLAYALNEMVHPDGLKGVVIRHKCDNPSCINVDHLEPGTTQDNTDDKVERGRHLFGELVGNSKLTREQVLKIQSFYVPRSQGNNQYQLAARYGVSQSQISQILAGKRWPHINKQENK